MIQELIASYAAYQVDKRWLTEPMQATGRRSLPQVTGDAFGIGDI